jgi:hypothetical protein
MTRKVHPGSQKHFRRFKLKMQIAQAVRSLREPDLDQVLKRIKAYIEFYAPGCFIENSPKKIIVTSKKARTIRVTSKKARKIKPEDVAKGLGAERVKSPKYRPRPTGIPAWGRKV